MEVSGDLYRWQFGSLGGQSGGSPPQQSLDGATGGWGGWMGFGVVMASSKEAARMPAEIESRRVCINAS